MVGGRENRVLRFRTAEIPRAGGSRPGMMFLAVEGTNEPL